MPSSDGKREKITLEQFLDTWASLIDYIVKNGTLPALTQDLVNLGVELYSTKSSAGKPLSIAPAAFEQLFQKMNLGRPYAFMAYKLLSEVCHVCSTDLGNKLPVVRRLGWDKTIGYG